MSSTPGSVSIMTGVLLLEDMEESKIGAAASYLIAAEKRLN